MKPRCRPATSSSPLCRKSHSRAGAERDLFSPAAIAALHDAVGGTLREVDRLAQAALREAARHKRRLIDAEHIQPLLLPAV